MTTDSAPNVEDPDALTVADQQLLVRLFDDPAEFSRPRQLERAIGALHRATVAVDDRLRELRPRGLRVAHERAQPIERHGIRDG